MRRHPQAMAHAGGTVTGSATESGPGSSTETVRVSGRAVRGLGVPELLSPRQRRRRAASLVLLTLVLPGSAQLVAGSRRFGSVALRVWAALMAGLVVLAVLALASRSLAIGLVGQSWFLTAVQGALFGFAALWAVLFVDAWRLGRPRTLTLPGRRRVSGLTGVLLLLLPGGLLYAGNSVAAGRDALGAMFADGPAAPSTDGRYNVLLLGGDSGRNRVGTRPDSIQLVSIHEDTGRAVVFGFSRDMENIDFREGSVMRRLMPEGWNCGDACLLNGIYTWAQEHRDRFPAGTQDPGILATREAVEAISGLTVHYHVLVDLRGFSGMVDALGGLDVTVQRRTPIGGGTSPVTGWIEPGRQHLNGYQALWYARSRQGSTNYERMARQRCVMTAMVAQLDPQTVALRFADIAAASSGIVRTDLPASELGAFADLALKTRSQKIKSVNFVPPLIKPWDYDAAFVRSTVASTIAASEKAGAANQGRPRATTPTPSARAGTATPRPAATSRALDRPAEDPQAATEDLARVCSAG